MSKTNEQSARDKLSKHLASIDKTNVEINSATQELNTSKTSMDTLAAELEAKGVNPNENRKYLKAVKAYNKKAQQLEKLQNKKKEQESKLPKLNKNIENAKLKDQQEQLWKKREEELRAQGSGKVEAFIQVQLEKAKASIKEGLSKITTPIGEVLRYTSGFVPKLVNKWLGVDEAEEEIEKEKEEEVTEVVEESNDLIEERREDLEDQIEVVNDIQSLSDELNNTYTLEYTIQDVEEVNDALQEIQTLELPPPAAPLLALPPPMDDSSVVDLVTAPILESINNRENHYERIYTRAFGFGNQATTRIEDIRSMDGEITEQLVDMGKTIVQSVFQAEMDIIEALSGDDTISELLEPLAELANSAVETQQQIDSLENRNVNNLRLIESNLEDSLAVQDNKLNVLALSQEESNELLVDQVEHDIIEYEITDENLDLMESQIDNQLMELAQQELENQALIEENKVRDEKGLDVRMIGRLLGAAVYGLGDKLSSLGGELTDDMEIPSISEVTTAESESYEPSASYTESETPSSSSSTPSTSPSSSVASTPKSGSGSSHVLVNNVTQPIKEVESSIVSSEMDKLATRG